MNGGLLIILIQSDAAVYFVMDKHKADYHFEYHLYSVTKQGTRLQCVNINDLVDFYPLPSYVVNENKRNKHDLGHCGGQTIQKMHVE